ncbi:MAG: hypothetical protein ACREQI_01750 [Candidatus Binataceae bacterium]
MIVPPVAHRREIDRNLAEFFRTDRPARFNRAISGLCRYFNVKRPRIEWYEYLDWGKTAGKTFEDGRIHLVHPSNWKRGRTYYTERQWIQMIYHEMGHFLFWTDAERKADLFSRRMVTGLRSAARRGGSRQGALRAGLASRRRSAQRIRRRRPRAAVAGKRRSAARIGAR